jgi:hypothetical protein
LAWAWAWLGLEWVGRPVGDELLLLLLLLPLTYLASKEEDEESGIRNGIAYTVLGDGPVSSAVVRCESPSKTSMVGKRLASFSFLLCVCVLDSAEETECLFHHTVTPACNCWGLCGVGRHDQDNHVTTSIKQQVYLVISDLCLRYLQL